MCFDFFFVPLRGGSLILALFSDKGLINTTEMTMMRMLDGIAVLSAAVAAFVVTG